MEVEGQIFNKKDDINIFGVRFNSDFNQKNHINYLNAQIPKFKYLLHNFGHFINIPNLSVIILSLIYGKANHTLSFQSEWFQGQYLKLQVNNLNNLNNKSIRRKILMDFKRKKFIND